MNLSLLLLHTIIEKKIAMAGNRVSFDDEGQLDELFAENASVHIERLSDGHVWISIERGGVAQIINLFTSRGGRIMSLTTTEKYMAKPPIKLKGIKVPGVRLKDGKVIKTDNAPPHVKAGRRRKANAITGVRPAK